MTRTGSGDALPLATFPHVLLLYAAVFTWADILYIYCIFCRAKTTIMRLPGTAGGKALLLVSATLLVVTIYVSIASTFTS